MQSVFERELVVITGKGGVGKTTIAAAVGLLGAQRGLETIVVEVGDQTRLPELFGHPAGQPGAETRLRQRLSSISIDPDRALLEWLQALGGRVSGRLLASSGTFQYFAAAAPGAKEMVSMVKIWELTQGKRWQRRAAGYDLVVLDAPATGNALGMLGSPQTFGAIARVGPIAGQSQRVRDLLESPARTAYLGVAMATEMAVSEALELQEALRAKLGRTLETVIVNGAAAAALHRRRAPADRDVEREWKARTPPRANPRAPRPRREPTAPCDGRPRSPREPSTTGHASSTTRWRGCAGEASTSSGCPSCGSPAWIWRRSNESQSSSSAGDEAALGAGSACRATH